MAESSKTAQISFITRIREVIPPSHSLVDELADTLGISNDSAYRRIRGETSLTIDEVSRLCTRYKLTFDVFGNSMADRVTFNYHHLENDIARFETYLKNIRDDLKKITVTEKKEMIFAAEDVPVFHHFSYPLLSAFKIFYWNKSILNAPSLEGKKFDPALIPGDLCQLAKEIYTLYMDVPAVEIWTDDTLNSTLKQIEYYMESGLFETREQAIAVCDEVEAMIRTIERQAEHSIKFTGENPPPGRETNYTLYNSELMIGNNCVLVTIGSSKAVYLSHNTFNSMVTINPSFCEETERWLRNLSKKSIPISGVSEKQRYRFFKILYDKIDAVKKKVETTF
ncbi:MAG: Uncharacterized protein FD123_2323 [Bacteroidetes bacterium]|nr:MAG: Uncharacterized protein FD123_2323 [Bacteroidota bacterium]